MEETYISSSDQDTREIASKLVESLDKGSIIFLIGPMAAGKTTFSQGVGDYLGISRIVSPTYMIMREYPVSSHAFIQRLYHLDLYRINSAEDLKSFDIEEVWNQPENLLLIEWPENLKDLLPSKRIEVHFKVISDIEREIKIVKHQTK